MTVLPGTSVTRCESFTTYEIIGSIQGEEQHRRLPSAGPCSAPPSAMIS